MTIIQSRDLEARGLLNDQSSALEIQGKWFKPGPSFAKSSRQIAIEFCEEAVSQGRQYILIEFPSYLMAWQRIHLKTPAVALSEAEAHPPNPPLGHPGSPAHPDLSHPTVSLLQPTSTESVTPQQGEGVNLDEAFINQCKAELAFHIGPMAKWITEQTLQQSTQLTPKQLIEALAAHISDSKAALLFRQSFELQ
ncbi:MAG: hypothetical protein HC851_08770 [Acaryochloris sp. RU_4_1]|nr:hypothetical protein [Acaryochloris sp. RU_4_1]NJR53651.1 hypothetical protein [Acaryochloris sp. CRU_2_0]